MNQTVTNIEIVVVDNQSTDNTYELVAELAKTDGRIRLFRNEENLGPVRNWIKCVEYASAPYSKMLFSDDLLAPNCIERMLPELISGGCGLVYSSVILGSESWHGGICYKNFLDDCRIDRNAFLRMTTLMENFIPVSPGAALFRTADLRKNIATSLPIAHPYDFAQTGAGVDWLIYPLTALGYQYVSYLANPVIFFRSHDGSITVKNEGGAVTQGYVLAKQWLKSAILGL